MLWSAWARAEVGPGPRWAGGGAVAGLEMGTLWAGGWARASPGWAGNGLDFTWAATVLGLYWDVVH
jgi:hypothetical protein